MSHFQIGTSEPHDCVGSRAAKSTDLVEAVVECCERSLQYGIKEAWLRPVINGQIGPVIASFIKGVQEL